jgi:DNA primase
VTLPSGEDPDSLIRDTGAPAFEELLHAAKPLAERLWQSELDAKPITTPERRADLEHRLMAQAGTIADRVVQAEYRRFLRDKLFALGRQQSQGNGRRFPLQRLPPVAVAGNAPPPPPAPARRQREILIGMLLEHPFLVAEAHEDIVFLDFPEPDLDSLRRAILDADTSPHGLDAEALRQHLGQNGFASAVDAALAVLADHAGYVLETSDAAAARGSLSHLMGMLRAGERIDRVDEGLGGEVYDDPSGEAWQRRHGWDPQDALTEDDFLPRRPRRTGKSAVRNQNSRSA